MSTEAPHPRVGVAAIIYNRNRPGQFITGKRIGSHGADTIQLPGGHLEYGESFLACAERETLEETGLKVRAIKHVATTNDVFEKEKKHYITIFIHCEMLDVHAEPKVLEPQKCAGWYWASWDDLKKINAWGGGATKLFLPLINLLAQPDGIESPEQLRELGEAKEPKELEEP
ncbi:ADP-ribose pyrophosphatase [Fusarium beomiforme]|uniref:ADP-ribose pyrophosphatase n=1 Tax=Fusarium beomiforme TaxID=44412 RepID=A0A9P5AE29_9HYPO|nr:ADP-ribose pyrophosphatase [Fusarium beomiforme]